MLEYFLNQYLLRGLQNLSVGLILHLLNGGSETMEFRPLFGQEKNPE